MKIVNQGDTIGTAICDGCENEVAVKVNKNGCVYIFCNHIIRDHEGKKERCFTRQSYGRDHSKKLIEQFLAKENEHGKDQPGRTEQQPAAADAGPGDKVQSGADKPAGIGAAVRQFFT